MGETTRFYYYDPTPYSTVLGPVSGDKLRRLYAEGTIKRDTKIFPSTSDWRDAVPFEQMGLDKSQAQEAPQSSAEDAPEHLRGLEATATHPAYKASKNGQQLGPFPKKQHLKQMVASGELGATDLVWVNKVDAWVPVIETELRDYIPHQPVQAPPPHAKPLTNGGSPLPDSAQQQAQSEDVLAKPHIVLLLRGSKFGTDDDNESCWWHPKSTFSQALITRLRNTLRDVALDDPIPSWDGAYSHLSRRAAAYDLLQRLWAYENLGLSYSLIGHSDGGYVIWEALKEAVRTNIPLPNLRSWATVGTPFYCYQLLGAPSGLSGWRQWFRWQLKWFFLAIGIIGVLTISVSWMAQNVWGTTLDTNIASWIACGVMSVIMATLWARKRFPVPDMSQKAIKAYGHCWLGVTSANDEAVNLLLHAVECPTPIVETVPFKVVPNKGVLPTLLDLGRYLYKFAFWNVVVSVTSADKWVKYYLLRYLQGTDDPDVEVSEFGFVPVPCKGAKEWAVLHPDVDKKVQEQADASATQLVHGLRGTLRDPNNHDVLVLGMGSLRRISEQGLIHTSYFDVPEIRSLLAQHIEHPTTTSAVSKDVLSVDDWLPRFHRNVRAKLMGISALADIPRAKAVTPPSPSLPAADRASIEVNPEGRGTPTQARDVRITLAQDDVPPPQPNGDLPRTSSAPGLGSQRKSDSQAIIWVLGTAAVLVVSCLVVMMMNNTTTKPASPRNSPASEQKKNPDVAAVRKTNPEATKPTMIPPKAKDAGGDKPPPPKVDPTFEPPMPFQMPDFTLPPTPEPKSKQPTPKRKTTTETDTFNVSGSRIEVKATAINDDTVEFAFVVHGVRQDMGWLSQWLGDREPLIKRKIDELGIGGGHWDHDKVVWPPKLKGNVAFFEIVYRRGK